MRILGRIVFFSLFTITIADYVTGQCAPAPDSRVTFWGHQNAVWVNERPLKALRGEVVLGLVPDPERGEGVLVEVFDHGELAADGDQRRVGQKRLQACITDEKGRFSFRVRPGRYELRASRPPDWNATSVIVEIAKGGSSERLSVTLTAAQ